MITDVTLSENVSLSEDKAVPSNILTKKQGVKKLQKGTLADKVHQISEGEALVEVAKKYDLTLDKLLDLNEGLKESSVLQIGQELHVTDYQPFVDVIVNKETKVKETIDYETKVVKSDDLYKGEEEVKQQGAEGQSVVHYSLETHNGSVTDRNMVEEKTTKESVKKSL